MIFSSVDLYACGCHTIPHMFPWSFILHIEEETFTRQTFLLSFLSLCPIGNPSNGGQIAAAVGLNPLIKAPQSVGLETFSAAFQSGVHSHARSARLPRLLRGSQPCVLNIPFVYYYYKDIARPLAVSWPRGKSPTLHNT